LLQATHLSSAKDGSYICLLNKDLLPFLPVRVRVAAAGHKHYIPRLYRCLSEYAIFPPARTYRYYLALHGQFAMRLGDEDEAAIARLRQALDKNAVIHGLYFHVVEQSFLVHQWFSPHLPLKLDSFVLYSGLVLLLRFSLSMMAIACFWLLTFGPLLLPLWSWPFPHFDMTLSHGISFWPHISDRDIDASRSESSQATAPTYLQA
jgi:hypothetical protein